LVSRRTAIAASCSSALLLWAAMPPLGLGPLAWIALVPVAAVAARSPATRTAHAAVPLAYALYLELLLVPALPFGLTDDQWGDAPLPLLIGGSPVLVIACVAIPLLGLALYVLRFPLPWPRIAALQRNSRYSALMVAGAFVLVPALSWAALDLARVKLDPGGLWGPLFLSQHDVFTARLSALAGPWLITVAIVAVNFALALLLVRQRSAAPVAAVTSVVVVALLLIAPSPPSPDRRSGVLNVAAVQPGYDTSEFENPVLRHFRTGSYELAALDMIRDLGSLTGRAAGRGAELVVWPEAALWVDPHRTPSVSVALTRLARSTETTLIVPYFLPQPGQGATVSVTPDGSFTRAQPKQRPMWFWGEDSGNRVPPRPVATPTAKIGTLLGVDNQDPAPARLLTARGAGVISSSTHDWKQLAPTQQAFAQLHAIESHAPVVRADWRFASAVFDARGEKLADAGSSRRRTVVVAPVSPRRGSTPYADLGDAFGWAALGLALALTGAGAATGFRKARASRARAASPPCRRPVPSSPS
jgi:apolipoprotein N-acyltransferase